MFVDTLPSPYYDMLVINAFVEFEDLMYSVGRIEDGIKRGKIVDIEASMMEKRRSKPDEHVPAMFKERKSKRKLHTTWEKPVENYPHSSSYAQILQAGFSSPQKFVWKRDRDSDSGYLRGKKRKKIKVYHAFPMTYGELLPVLI